MTRFAHRCLNKMSTLTKQLEMSLGPSTADLKGRCGLHSGPVTAGVLRGQKARFQLFGDTMNTASRIESSGVPGRIHVSQETALLLEEAGKADWVIPRNELVTLKGKGELQTFFVRPTSKSATIVFDDSLSFARFDAGFNGSSDYPLNAIDIGAANWCDRANENGNDRTQRLVRWNAEILHSHLLALAADRHRLRRLVQCQPQEENQQKIGREQSEDDDGTQSGTQILIQEEMAGEIARRARIDTIGDARNFESSAQKLLDEMTESIEMREFFPKDTFEGPANDLIPSPVKQEILAFVSRIASLYRQIPFHNFEHASHVTMSAGKLMKRIMNPDEIDITRESVEIARNVHQKTYGISSDPLMQFAVVFSALIHDVDHTGYTNKEMIDSKAAVASVYGQRSVAEQNSVDVAWRVLMENEFQGLRNCIYSTREEKQRFRQMVVNAVLATDIADAELQRLRKNRWDATFSNETSLPLDSKGLVDRKATIVFEYIIQASDVIHCMQHWLTYQKFNARLFEERYVAWMQSAPPGTDDPSVGWYDGEIWFFDNYIIPLAQKLHECGVFGVSYYESLGYAQQNRVEWQRKGRGIVDKMLVQCRRKYHLGAANAISTKVAVMVSR
jgi:3'5'-cyclic nucleotide phosphodiesterase/Adenylate and Guanylate cyclase catalytic domain